MIDETLTTVNAVVLEHAREACLIQIYPTGPGMGTRYPLDNLPMVIGRGGGCQILANDSSVSRRHAQIEWGDNGYRAIDLESTNGTLVNKVRAPSHDLKDGDYLQVGKCIYRFLASGNVESAYHEVIYRLTIIDSLTNVFNKRYFLEALENELARAIRHNRPLGLILFDIDHFKKINDRWGHLAGDHILRDLAAALQPGFRREEVFARYGGEEFAVVLPECTPAGVRAVGERIRSVVERQVFLVDNQPCPVTVSVGVASRGSGEELTAPEFIARADAKLYNAKARGRNCVVG